MQYTPTVFSIFLDALYKSGTVPGPVHLNLGLCTEMLVVPFCLQDPCPRSPREEVCAAL